MDAAHSLVWAAGFLSLAQMLLAQTGSPIEKQGRYWIQTEEGSLPTRTRLRVTSTGHIAVTGGTSKKIHYKIIKKLRAKNQREAAQLLSSVRVKTALQNATTSVSVITPNCYQCNFTANMSLSIPRSTQYTTLETAGGNLKIAGVTGSVNAETANGSVELEDISGHIRATTAGGFIRVGSVGGDVRCDTAGGSIELAKAGGGAILTTSGGNIQVGEVKETLQAETLAGSIQAQKVGGNVMAGTSGGSIEIGQVHGLVNVDTAGGSIKIKSAPAGVRAETANGNISLSNVAGVVRAATAAGNIQVSILDGKPLKDVHLESLGGRILVFLPESLPATVDARVDLANRLNRILSEFSDIVVKRAENTLAPSVVRAFGDINGGGPTLNIHSTGGKIQIRKQ